MTRAALFLALMVASATAGFLSVTSAPELGRIMAEYAR